MIAGGAPAGTRIDIDSNAAVGADFPFSGGRWAFHTGLSCMKTDAEGIDVDPMIATFGFAYRF